MSKAKPMPSQEYLNECFSYDMDTGFLTWKERPISHFSGKSSCNQSNSRSSLKRAGCVYKTNSGKKYVRVLISQKGYLAHRVIWVMLKGFEPEQLDHINGNGEDNRIENLRASSHSENTKNNRRRKDNISGVTGVFFDKNSSKWKAEIRVNTKKIALGYYKDIGDAEISRKAAEKRFCFHKNHGSNRPL